MDFTKFLNESKWNQLKLSDVEVEEDGRTFIQTPKGLYHVLTIKLTKFQNGYKVNFTNHEWDRKGYFFLDKDFNFDELSHHGNIPFEIDDQYQKFFKSAKLNEVYYVYVDKNNMNLNKNFYTVLIK